MKDKILLSVRKLVKEYENSNMGKKSKFKAINNISFDIYEGECLALVGESGCGKSSLAKTILSLQKADEGYIYLKDKDVFELDKSKDKSFKKNIQMIFQDPYASLNPRMKIYDIVAEPIKAHKLYKDKTDLDNKVHTLLEKVGISKEFAIRYPHQFSGGQRQRIGIARAIALNPSLLILDEPVSALDVSIQAQVLNLLKDIKEEKKLTYLFISHDLSVVKFISDRIMIMFLGKIMEMGNTEDIFSFPRHPYTKLLLDSIPDIENKEKLYTEYMEFGEIPSISKPPRGCVFHTRCPYAKEICSTELPTETKENGRLYFCHFPLEE